MTRTEQPSGNQVYNSGLNVLEAARQRVAFLFDHFEDIKVSISGGKDSTVLAHLMLVEAQRRGRRIGLFFLDEEIMYQSTVDQVEHMMEQMAPDHVIPLWLQVEFNLTSAISYEESHLRAWEAGKHKIWMRPKKSYAIKFPPWDRKGEIILNRQAGLDFYAVIANFEACYSGAAFVVGLRGVEHPNRWRTMLKNPVDVAGTPVYWATQKGQNAAFYPLYDWNFHDIWKYIWENNLRYSRVYDWQFRKGVSINEMRVSSLIHERSFKSLVELPEYEPDTYNRLLKRVKGVGFAQETGKSAKMFRARKLPQNYHSWREYRDFLLATYPDAERQQAFAQRFGRHLDNEFVARQQCRQLILNDIENNIPVENKPDPRDELIAYYMEVL